MSTITQKGQVTIPKDIRKKLDVKQGDEVVFEVEHGKIVVRKKEKKPQIRKYIGYLKDKEGQSVDEIIRQMREGIE